MKLSVGGVHPHRQQSAASGLFRLGEVEDLAVSLAQVLLLLEVDLERPFDGHEGDAALGGEPESREALKMALGMFSVGGFFTAAVTQTATGGLSCPQHQQQL